MIVVKPVQHRQLPVRSVGSGVDAVDYFGARQDAITLQRKAIELGAKAGRAYTSDKKMGGGVAAYYLQKVWRE